VPKAGDYYTVQIGRQPMLMVRGSDGKVNVLYNRCPHRGNMMCGDRHGNTGEFFRCSYHAWTFHHDGKLRTIPMMESGYAGTRWARTTRLQHEARRARRELPRLRVRQPGERRADAEEFLANRASRSTTCATARPRARSRWCRTASASSSTPTGRSSSRTSSTRCIPR
jgi:phenylpropionate dioxygenase-like ring-hydroxylating dioxygenase large terminal subunit